MNNNTMNMTQYQTVFDFDPYVYETLMSVVGSPLMVETTGMPSMGTLMDVKPDHIVLQDPMSKQTRFVRIKEIVTIIPM